MEYFPPAILVSLIFKTHLIRNMKWNWGLRIMPLSYQLK
jgi:hypothetical protein